MQKHGPQIQCMTPSMLFLCFGAGRVPQGAGRVPVLTEIQTVLEEYHIITVLEEYHKVLAQRCWKSTT